MSWLDALLDEPFVCITDMLRRFATERAGVAALICDNEVLTYAELDARVDRFAAALQRDGIQPRDAIALRADSRFGALVGAVWDVLRDEVERARAEEVAV